MLYYDKIDISERIDLAVAKSNNSKQCMILPVLPICKC